MSEKNQNKDFEQELRKQIEQNKEVTNALKKMLAELERQQNKNNKVENKKK